MEAGPYLEYGLSASSELCFGDECESETINWEEDGLKRLDLGIQAGAGLNINAHLFINA